MYLICKVPFTRKCLDKLVTKEYVLKYLGDFTGSKQLYKLVGATTGIIGIEAATEYLNHARTEKNLKVSTTTYERIYGANHENWTNSCKNNYLKHQKSILNSNNGGLVSQMMRNDNQETNLKTITSGIIDFVKEMRRN